MGFGQLSIAVLNTPSTQSFNTLPSSGTGSTNAWGNNSTLPAWYIIKDKAGVVANVSQIDAGIGDVAESGRIYSFGSVSSSDRALGAVANTTQGNFLYGLRVKNTTGTPVQSITVSYTGEQWRDAGNASLAAQSLTFDYLQQATAGSSTSFWPSITGYTSIPQLNFTSLINTSTAGSLDGNAAANRIAITHTFNVNIPNNEEIILRWTDINDLNNDHGLGIDDFSVTFFSTLPITLSSFTGKEANKSILLNWVTASEKNNKNFEVLRSVDGKSFKTIGTIDGAGNSDKELKYSFVDANPFGGTNYYQLKQIDFDGKNATSSTIAIDSKIEDTKITVYAANTVNIGITSPNETTGKLSLFDISGRKITEQNISLNKGYNALTLNENLTPGVHFVILENEGKLYRQKFVK